MTGYYAEKLEEGLRFQDFVVEALARTIGLVISPFSSRESQTSRGETVQGIEIKLDSCFQKTGNLYIETEEKSDPARTDFVRSGIYRDDNSWLFLIGDRSTLFLFSTKYLRWLHRRGDYQVKGNATSRGFVLPRAEADKWCLRRIDLQSEAAR